jgi:adenylate kinase
LYLILLGPPGTGKGTQADLLAERLGWPHISTGEMLRQAVREGTDLGKKAKSYMDEGQLVPDQLITEMLLERISQLDSQGGLILDGYPRNLGQAEALDKALAARGRSIDKALYIGASDNELVARLGGRWLCRECGAVYHERHSPPAQPGRCDRCGGQLYQRDDDRPETVRRRLELQRPPEELLEHYRRAGKLVEVDGEQDMRAVTRSLLAAVGTGESA